MNNMPKVEKMDFRARLTVGHNLVKSSFTVEVIHTLDDVDLLLNTAEVLNYDAGILYQAMFKCSWGYELVKMSHNEFALCDRQTKEHLCDLFGEMESAILDHLTECDSDFVSDLVEYGNGFALRY